MEADRKIGWPFQKSTPSFRTQYLKMVIGLPPQDLITVKCAPNFTQVATPFFDLRPKGS